jgi:ATP-dependent RNA helicase DDX46/PRP5
MTGIYYEQGKEPPLEGPPKLHLLVESNEEYRVSKIYVSTLLDLVN